MRRAASLRRACGVGLLALACLVGIGGQGRAAIPDWGRDPYTYVTVDQELQQVLREFAANVGVTIQISPNVQGMVRGRLPSLPPDQFLELLKPEALAAAVAERRQAAALRLQPGYDHSYFFVASFMPDHVAFHAEAMRA